MVGVLVTVRFRRRAVDHDGAGRGHAGAHEGQRAGTDRGETAEAVDAGQGQGTRAVLRMPALLPLTVPPSVSRLEFCTSKVLVVPSASVVPPEMVRPLPATPPVSCNVWPLIANEAKLKLLASPEVGNCSAEGTAPLTVKALANVVVPVRNRLPSPGSTSGLR